MYHKIFNKIDTIIKNNGISYYLKQWKKHKMKHHYKNKIDFINDLAKYVKSYHPHSSIIYKNIYIQTKKQYKNTLKLKYTNEDRKMPKFSFVNKIGKITFFTFILDNSNNKKNIDDQNKLVFLVKKHLKLWNKKNIRGLILDFRYHYGGSVFPHYMAFSNLFNNSTIYAWYNKKAEKDYKVWVNIENGKIKHNRIFINKHLNFNKPIAIIIGKYTSSAGEFAALTFYGRDKVKFFGQNTAGYLSGNKIIKINNDIELILTEDLVTTVDGTFHIKEKIYPDKKTNKPIVDAIKWINSFKS